MPRLLTRFFPLALGVLALGACGTTAFSDDGDDGIVCGEDGPQGAADFQITDSGIRCEVAPCPVYQVSGPCTPEGSTVSRLVFVDSVPEARRQRALELVRTPRGLRAHGTVRSLGDERVFEVESFVE